MRIVFAVELTLHLVNLFKNIINVDITVQRVIEIFNDLTDIVGQLHTHVRDKAVEDVRKRTLWDMKKNHNRIIRFCEDDFVMVTTQGNATNIIKKGKPAINWQGPYVIVGSVSVSKCYVRLLGDLAVNVNPVHWDMMKKFAGPDSIDLLI